MEVRLVVDGHGDRDLRGGDEVHRCPVFCEHVEDPAQEPVCVEHTVGLYGDERDAPLGGDGLEALVPAAVGDAYCRGCSWSTQQINEQRDLTAPH